MELESGERNVENSPRGWRSRIRRCAKAAEHEVLSFGKTMKKLGKDDPRRIIHSFKVGLAITLVSLLYYIRPLYDGYGVSGMWAVLTVVVVFEFTVGGTLSRCINRGCATFFAAILGVGALKLASIFPEVARPIVIGVLVFALAGASTFTRFSPVIKARYDYGVLIFILTFTMVSVSGYRSDELLELARQRILTIVIGAAVCVIVSMCLCPVWAGEELHNMAALHMEKLAIYLEGFGSRYFEREESAVTTTLNNDKTPSIHGYKGILVSKTAEDVLANFARWEMIRHGQFRFCHPWENYLKIANLARKCAYRIEALDGYLKPHVQATRAFRDHIEDSCVKISFESSMALKILSESIRSMTDPLPADTHVKNSIIAIKGLERTLEEVPFDKGSDLSAILPCAAVASILAQVADCVKHISEAVHELAREAASKGVVGSASSQGHVPQTIHRSSIAPVEIEEECVTVVVMVQEKDDNV